MSMLYDGSLLAIYLWSRAGDSKLWPAACLWKVFLEHIHAHLFTEHEFIEKFMYYLQLLSQNNRQESQQRPHGLQSLKNLLSGLLGLELTQNYTLFLLPTSWQR